ncbi:spore germination protein GerPC [Virgibacillus senegalensis]|uniref:spore germination protein GerPC n=1 Tax=Virgibacillus senegalensis TaxID=1499679 RepID=UPI00069F1EA7|nr:spore germination protein GerPC [Virgibacillus senegalensis]
MHPPPYWQTYFQQLQQYIQNQDQRLQDLEARVADLEKSQKTNHTNVERIDYHFDQLKIERLDGTLHIGVSPEGLDSIEDFAVNQQQKNGLQPYSSAPGQQIISGLDRFITSEAPKLLNELSRQYQRPLSPKQKDMLIKDIKQQLPERAAYYLENRDGDSPDAEHIHDRIWQEINHSLHEFFQKGEFPE